MDKAPGYRKIIQDLNHRCDPHFDNILPIDRKGRNIRIESDHAALKRLSKIRRSVRSKRSLKATIIAIETIRTIRAGDASTKAPGVRGEIDLVRTLFGKAA